MKEVGYEIFRITLLHNLNRYLDKNQEIDIKLLQDLPDNSKSIPCSLEMKQYTDLTSLSTDIFTNNPFLITTFSATIIEWQFPNFVSAILDLPELDVVTFMHIVAKNWRNVLVLPATYAAQIKKIDSYDVRLNIDNNTLNAVLFNLYHSNTEDRKINYLLLFKIYSLDIQQDNGQGTSDYHSEVITALSQPIHEIFNENLTPDIFMPQRFMPQIWLMPTPENQRFDKIQKIFNHIFNQQTAQKIEPQYKNLAIKYIEYIRDTFLEIKDISQETVDSIICKKNLQKQCLDLFKSLDLSNKLIQVRPNGDKMPLCNECTIKLKSDLLDALPKIITHDELQEIQAYNNTNTKQELIGYINKISKEKFVNELESIYNTDKFTYYILTKNKDSLEKMIKTNPTYSNIDLSKILEDNPKLTLNIFEKCYYFLEEIVCNIAYSLGFENFELPQIPDNLMKYIGDNDE